MTAPAGTLAGAEAPGAAAAPGQPAADVLDDITAIREAIQRVVRVGADRARVGAREKAMGLVLASWFGIAAIAATAVAALYVLRGVAGGLSDLLGDRPWAGDLAAGVLFFAGGALCLSAVRRGQRRRGLAQLRRRYATAAPRRSTP